MGAVFLIVDDETLSRNYISDLLKEFVPGAVIHEISSVKAALELINSAKPDVLFLDINLPGVDGFSLLESVKTRDFELVFVTAYSQYAIKAFKEGARDYILKPIKKSEFKVTLEKVLKHRQQEIEWRKYKAAKGNDAYETQKLSIAYQGGVKTIDLSSIVYFEANNSYTVLHLLDKEEVTTSKPINYFEKLLNVDWFFRVHKSYIVNLHYFKEYFSETDKLVLMQDGSRLPISRYRAGDFLKRIKNLRGKV